MQLFYFVCSRISHKYIYIYHFTTAIFIFTLWWKEESSILHVDINGKEMYTLTTYHSLYVHNMTWFKPKSLTLLLYHSLLLPFYFVMNSSGAFFYFFNIKFLISFSSLLTDELLWMPTVLSVSYSTKTRKRERERESVRWTKVIE